MQKLIAEILNRLHLREYFFGNQFCGVGKSSSSAEPKYLRLWIPEPARENSAQPSLPRNVIADAAGSGGLQYLP
jgi:hypothetical protein